MRDTIANHTHGGNDGSTYIFNDGIALKSGQQFQSGNVAFGELVNPDVSSIFGVVLVGGDTIGRDGVSNAQLTIDHQPTTTGSTNQTFFYGLRPPLFVGSDGEIDSGGTTLRTNKYDFGINELAGAFVIVRDPAEGSSTFNGFTIASNTRNTITITGGSWSFASSSNADFVIFVPMYLGSADYPWRRLYVLSDSTGGIRFGLGNTAGGQNALLFWDSAASELKIRKTNGLTYTIETSGGS